MPRRKNRYAARKNDYSSDDEYDSEDERFEEVMKIQKKRDLDLESFFEMYKMVKELGSDLFLLEDSKLSDFSDFIFSTVDNNKNPFQMSIELKPK